MLGRTLTTTGPISGQVWTSTYDSGSGLPWQTTDPRGMKTTSYFDLAGRLINLTVADGSMTPVDRLWVYGAAGPLIAVRDGNGFYDEVELDSRLRPVKAYDRTGAVTRNEFDAANQLKLSIDPQGMKTSYTLNNRGWATQENVGGLISNFGYDAAGNNTSVASAFGTWTFDFNDASQLLKVTDPLTSCA